MKDKRELYNQLPKDIQVRAKRAYFAPKRIEVKTRAISEFLKARRLRRKHSTDGEKQVLVLHFWDTRPMFEDTWAFNTDIVSHNFELLEERLPKQITLHHHLSLHDISPISPVEDLLQELTSKYELTHHRFSDDLSDVGHFNKFNYVVNKAFNELEPEILSYDYIMFVQQDSLLINHLDKNIVAHLLSLLGDVSSDNREFGFFRDQPYRYVSHTIGGETDLAKFTHNAAVGRGLFAIDRYPLVKAAVSQSKNHRPAEVYLGDFLDERCLYLRPHDEFYYGDYFMEALTASRSEKLLEYATDRKKTPELINKAKNLRAGALHEFLGYHGDIVH